MITTIKVLRSTKELLNECGSKGQTYDKIVVQLAKEFLELRK